MEISSFLCSLHCPLLFNAILSTAEPLNLVISPIAATCLGGTLVAIAGPCFEDNSNLTCKFGDVITQGVVASPLTSYCVTPMLYQFGRMMLQVSLDGGVSYPYDANFTLRELI